MALAKLYLDRPGIYCLQDSIFYFIEVLIFTYGNIFSFSSNITVLTVVQDITY